MTRILAIADEIDRRLSPTLLASMAPDIVLSCGDLPHDYLERVVSIVNVPLLYVPGNHDPAAGIARPRNQAMSFADDWEQHDGPAGCTNVDGTFGDAAGLRVAGLGGSIRYSKGSHQYTDTQMRRKSKRLIRRQRWNRMMRGRSVDVLITHSPPRGLGDQTDPPHVGFTSFQMLIDTLEPTLMLHGHIHPFGIPRPDRHVGRTKIVNVIPYKLLEI